MAANIDPVAIDGTNTNTGNNGTPKNNKVKKTLSNDDDEYKSTSLYVGDLDETTSENTIYTHFNAISPVGSVHVCRNMVTRRSLGYAYVNFTNIKDSERAMEALNYSLIDGRACRIMWSNRNPNLRKSNRGNVFIKNLDNTIDNKQLHDAMAGFGEILSCKIACFPGGKSKGFGFVNFVTEESANQAIAALNGMKIKGKEVFVARFQKRNNNRYLDEWTNLYVRNIPADWTEDTLTDLFKTYGGVNSTKLNPPVNGQRYGYGFVDLDSHEAALEAVEAMHQKYLVDEIDHVEGEEGGRGGRRGGGRGGGRGSGRDKEGETGTATADAVNVVDPAVAGAPAAPDTPVDLATSDKATDAGAAPGNTTAATTTASEKGPEGTSTTGTEEAAATTAATTAPTTAATTAATTAPTTAPTTATTTAATGAVNSDDFKQKIYLYVQQAQRREDREKDRREKDISRREERARKFQGMNIYIKNLDDNVSDEVLRQEFDPFGTITSAKVMFNKEGQSRGFGFVCFSSMDEANMAISEMQGKTLHGKQINVSIAQPRNKNDYKSQHRYNNHHHHPRGTFGAHGGSDGHHHRHGNNSSNNSNHRHRHGNRRGGRGRGNSGGMMMPNMFMNGMMFPGQMFPGQSMMGRPMNLGGGARGPGMHMPGMGMHPGMLNPQMQQQMLQQQMQQQMFHQQQMQQFQQQQQQQGHHPPHHGQQGQPQTGQMQLTQQQQQQRPPQHTSRGGNAPHNLNDLSKMLASANNPKDRKHMIGEHLYPLISQFSKTSASTNNPKNRKHMAGEPLFSPGKITGMLLEAMDIPELLNLLEDPHALKKKVEEATEVLNNHTPRN